MYVTWGFRQNIDHTIGQIYTTSALSNFTGFIISRYVYIVKINITYMLHDKSCTTADPKPTVKQYSEHGSEGIRTQSHVIVTCMEKITQQNMENSK